jgi:anaerobic magnesium-protoporphyrin IX monomethyl ester cyclase
MRVLLLAGEGPYFKNSEYLDGTLFDREAAPRIERELGLAGLPGVRIENLRYHADGAWRPLLRSKRELIPHLTAFTLDSILHRTGADYELFRFERVWDGRKEPSAERFDVVFLSTTFICERHTLRRAIEWVEDRFGDAVLVLGGQYSNLKYEELLEREESVDYIVRGDGEQAVPGLLAALSGRLALKEVPNLAFRDESGACVTTGFEYIDIDEHPSPSFPGTAPVVPYESMRGCPFSCKFCSFPFASPKWRYKSAAKIAADWKRYSVENGATHIRAMDSTFTVPYRRMRELLDRLPSVGVEWEAYSRANNLKDEAMIEALEAAGCRRLSIGFESMSDRTLGLMNKLVKAEENRRALDLLLGSDISYRISVMVGYPGERREDYEETHRFLVEEYSGHFMLSVFSFLDETMPVWADADRFQLEITDPDNPDYSWRHAGMDVEQARSLMRRTLDEARARSERSQVLLWQFDYQTPLVPGLSKEVDMRLEKLVDRLGMAPRDHGGAGPAAPAIRSLLGELGEFGIRLQAGEPDTAAAAHG